MATNGAGTPGPGESDDKPPPSVSPLGWGRDARRWLAERGVEPQPLTGSPQGDIPAGSGPPRSAPPRAAGDGGGRLGDEVAAAISYALRATVNSPRSETRLREGMSRRGFSAAAVDEAVRRCRLRGIVDDRAFAAALVDEWVRKGDAAARIRDRLLRRGLPADVADEALGVLTDHDEEAAAYAVAVRCAGRLTGVDVEKAFRRLVGHLTRRGYGEAVARRVARRAVFDPRDRRPPAEA